jgi:hypothetical protein
MNAVAPWGLGRRWNDPAAVAVPGFIAAPVRCGGGGIQTTRGRSMERRRAHERGRVSSDYSAIDIAYECRDVKRCSWFRTSAYFLLSFSSGPRQSASFRRQPRTGGQHPLVLVLWDAASSCLVVGTWLWRFKHACLVSCMKVGSKARKILKARRANLSKYGW